MKATVVFERNWDALIQHNEDSSVKYKYIINSGSSRSSKTYSLLQIFYIYAISNPGKKLSVFRDTKQICKQTVFEDMKKVYPYLPGYKEQVVLNISESIYRFVNGSSIHIEGTDDEVKIHGYTCDMLWLNEPYNISESTFNQLDMRCSGNVFLDLNPRQDHWSEKVAKKLNAISIHSTFLMNPFCPIDQKLKILSYQPLKQFSQVLNKKISENDAKMYNLAANKKNFDEETLQELARCLDNERTGSANEFSYKVYALGTKGERPNRIFKWVEIPETMYNEIQEEVYYGIDWGSVDPWGIVEVKYYDGALYVKEINYKSENKIRETLSPTEREQIAAGEEGFVTWYFKKFGITEGSILICDDNRPKKIAALRLIGYNAMRADKGSNTSGTLIDSIDFLNDIQVFYTSTSTNLAFEQENYSRKIDRYGVVTEEPEDSNNHLIDPIRYVYGFLRRMGIIRKM